MSDANDYLFVYCLQKKQTADHPTTCADGETIMLMITDDENPKRNIAPDNNGLFSLSVAPRWVPNINGDDCIAATNSLGDCEMHTEVRVQAMCFLKENITQEYDVIDTGERQVLGVAHE